MSDPVIFCRSCVRDIDRFELQARTIARVLPSVSHVVCVDPSDFAPFVARVHDLEHCRVMHTPAAALRVDLPYLRQQVVKLLADTIVEGDTFQLDSDMYVDESFAERWATEVQTRPWYVHEPAKHERAGVVRYDALFELPQFRFGPPWRTGYVWMAPYGWWVRQDVARAARHLLLKTVYDREPAPDDRPYGSDWSRHLVDAIQALITHARHPFSEYHLLGALTEQFHPKAVVLNRPPQPLGIVHRTSADEFRELPELLAKERAR